VKFTVSCKKLSDLQMSSFMKGGGRGAEIIWVHQSDLPFGKRTSSQSFGAATSISFGTGTDTRIHCFNALMLAVALIRVPHHCI
jgi:hypothetical protein